MIVCVACKKVSQYVLHGSLGSYNSTVESRRRQQIPGYVPSLYAPSSRGMCLATTLVQQATIQMQCRSSYLQSPVIRVRGHFGLKLIFLEVWCNPFLHSSHPLSNRAIEVNKLQLLYYAFMF